jgi:hypothetical protein
MAGTAWALAERALNGVGDPALGEWREDGRHGIVHLRRRLTDAERRRAGGLGVRDIRGSGEERARLARLFREVPHLASAVGQ